MYKLLISNQGLEMFELEMLELEMLELEMLEYN